MSNQSSPSRVAVFWGHLRRWRQASPFSATGCSSESTLDKHELPVDPADEGKWVPAACWHNCGGRCMNKVMVKDGAVVRQKTDDTHEDSFDYPQQRGCVRGKAQQQQCFGADRVKYPMKRKNWSPENPNGDLRGKDEWERISWDEAISYIAEQMQIIKDKYGNQAFLLGSYGSRLRSSRCSPSAATRPSPTPPRTARICSTSTPLSAFPTRMRACATTVPTCSTPTPSSSILPIPRGLAAGMPSYHYIRAKEAGVKFIVIDPIYTASAQMLDAYWIPIRTGTDTAPRRRI